jgi:hypothetical protein
VAGLDPRRRILERWKDLVHTHFVTDGVRLSPERTREIEREFMPVLRASGVVFPIHFARASHERTIRIVLECQPSGKELERLERELGRILEPIPVRPPTTRALRVDGQE